MNPLKYVVSLGSLFVGFVLMAIKDAYQNLVLNLICSAMYSIGPNSGCDFVMKLPDFGIPLLLIGILGIVASIYHDFAGHPR